MIHGRTVTLTLLALSAFASNSILCRLALGPDSVDAVSFTGIRLASGAAMLAVLAAVLPPSRSTAAPSRAGWRSGLCLFAYAIAFSLAYRTLTAGTGALILFAAVQATVIAGALHAGERLRTRQWAGIGVAMGGLAYLTSPGLASPDPGGSVLMAAAGAAWGLYTLRGRGSATPLSDTSRNFTRAAPMALAVCAAAATSLHITPRGAILAVLSGAVASGLGYVAWYAALRGLDATRAAAVQLSVPALAAFGGVVLLAEPLSLRLVASAALILGGIGLVVFARATAATR